MFARQKLCSIHNNNHIANVRKAIWGNNGAASARALKVAVAENKMERETQRARDRVVESSRCPLPGVYMLAVRPSHCRWSHMPRHSEQITRGSVDERFASLAESCRGGGIKSPGPRTTTDAHKSVLSENVCASAGEGVRE